MHPPAIYIAGSMANPKPAASSWLGPGVFSTAQTCLAVGGRFIYTKATRPPSPSPPGTHPSPLGVTGLLFMAVRSLF